MEHEKSVDEIACAMLDNHDGPLGKSFKSSGVIQPTGPGGHVGDVLSAMGIEAQVDPRIEKSGQEEEVGAEVEEEPLIKSEGDLEKSKYVTRTGAPGSYRYTYAEGSKSPGKQATTKDWINRVVGETDSGKKIHYSLRPDKYYDDWSSADHANASKLFDNKESRIGHISDLRLFHNAMMEAKMTEELGDSGAGDARREAASWRKKAEKKIRVKGSEMSKSLDDQNKSLENTQHETQGLNAMEDFLEKSKYTKRTGTPGNYKYEYADPKGKGKKGSPSHHLTLAVSRVRIYADDASAPSARESVKVFRDTRQTANGIVGTIGGRGYTLSRGYDGGYWLTSFPDGRKPVKYEVSEINGSDPEKADLSEQRDGSGVTGNAKTTTEKSMSSKEILEDYLCKGGPYIGPRGGKWADAKHTIAWDDKKHSGGKKEPKSREHNEDNVRELQLMIENEGALHSQHMSIVKNLVNRMASGTYDHAKASKLYGYLADAGAKAYVKAHGGSFSKGDRMAVARSMASDFHDEAKAGDWDYLLNKKNAKAKGGSLNSEEKKKLGSGVKGQGPSRKFDVGIKVRDGDKTGTIQSYGEYDSDLGSYRVKVREDGGGTKNWNEKNMQKVAKSMSGSEILEDYLCKGAAGGLPTGNTNTLTKQKNQAIVGGSADGGSLDGGGHGAYEASDLSSSQGRNAPGVNKQKLSDDDADVDGQMKTHKKPIEKSMSGSQYASTPCGMRDSVAHGQAQSVSQLRKSAEELKMAVAVRQLSADEQASALVKSQGFYSGGSPTLDLHQDIDITSAQQCMSCSTTFAKSLTACPDCGLGQVGHRVAPGQYVGGDVSVRAEYDPILRKSKVDDDVCFGRPDPVRVIG